MTEASSGQHGDGGGGGGRGRGGGRGQKSRGGRGGRGKLSRIFRGGFPLPAAAVAAAAVHIVFNLLVYILKLLKHKF